MMAGGSPEALRVSRSHARGSRDCGPHPRTARPNTHPRQRPSGDPLHLSDLLGLATMSSPHRERGAPDIVGPRVGQVNLDDALADPARYERELEGLHARLPARRLGALSEDG